MTKPGRHKHKPQTNHETKKWVSIDLKHKHKTTSIYSDTVEQQRVEKKIHFGLTHCDYNSAPYSKLVLQENREISFFIFIGEDAKSYGRPWFERQ